MIHPGRWFREVWPRDAGRQAVISDYATVGQCRHFLTDVAIRGSVFAPFGDVTDALQLARLEGRRELALEIIRTAGEEPGALYRYVEKAGKA